MTTQTRLVKALAQFQDAMPTIPKNRVARSGGRDYRYADLADVTAAARPVMSECGLVFLSAPGISADGSQYVTGRLVHVETGESVEGSLTLHGRHMQDIGSGITYARRYLLACLTGLVTDDDDDGAASVAGSPVTVTAPGEDKVAALRTALDAATTVEELQQVYADHDLRSAPPHIKDEFRARVDAIRTPSTDDAPADGEAVE
ncbi:ERF family protein [Nocardioides sp.]|uniref:ERF family protein n=1 Tax=Nocardioides sp. TaxID=35761 RepID=UPI0039E263B5